MQSTCKFNIYLQKKTVFKPLLFVSLHFASKKTKPKKKVTSNVKCQHVVFLYNTPRGDGPHDVGKVGHVCLARDAPRKIQWKCHLRMEWICHPRNAGLVWFSILVDDLVGD